MIGAQDSTIDEIYNRVKHIIDNIYRKKGLTSIEIKRFFDVNRNFKYILKDMGDIKHKYDENKYSSPFEDKVFDILNRILMDRIYYEKDNPQNENLKNYKSFVNENKIFESYYKPEPKYPVNYKCLDLMTAMNEIKHTYGFHLTEIEAPGSKYGTKNFFGWCGENLEPIYPKYTMSDNIFEYDKKKYAGYPIKATKPSYFEEYAVYELPIKYDATGDEISWEVKRDNFRKDMTNMMKHAGEEYNMDNEKHIDFGPKSNNWVNVALKAFYELYSEYYVNGKLLIWNEEYEYSREKNIFDYPMDKAIILSDIEKWISDFEIDTTGFYEWILNCQYVEGRYWNRTWTYAMEDVNFRKIKTNENIKKINELLRQLYKEEQIDIYIDYYKEVKDEIFD